MEQLEKEGADIKITQQFSYFHISQLTWSYFTSINFSIIGPDDENEKVIAEFPETALEGIGYDSLGDLLGLLSNYINKDPVTLLSVKDETGKLYLDRVGEEKIPEI